MFGLLALFWLFYQVVGMLFFGIDFCIIYYERRNLNHKATTDVAKRSAFFFGGGGIFVRHFYLIFKNYLKYLKRIVREYS